MKIKNNFLKKSLFFWIVVFQIFALSLPVALAKSVSVTNVGKLYGKYWTELIEEASEVIEQRFNMNQESISEVMSTVNASPYKNIPPQVQITFNPPNPRPGEKVTATAIPTYFNGQASSMYFTWYLHRDKAIEGNSGNIMKIRAAKIMANGGAYEDETDEKWSDDWSNIIKPGSSGEDLDNDGYEAIFGGESPTAEKNAEDNSNSDGSGAKHCYVHDFNTGINHEVTCKHQFPGSLCKGDSFKNYSELFWDTNPLNADTDGDGTKDEADLCGLAQDRFTWNYKPGDKVGVIVEGTSFVPTKYGDSSYMIFWALPKNTCEVTGKTTGNIYPAPANPTGGGADKFEIAGLSDLIAGIGNDIISNFLALLINSITGFSEVDLNDIKNILQDNVNLLSGATISEIVTEISDQLEANLGCATCPYPGLEFDSALFTASLDAIITELSNGYNQNFQNAAEMDTEDKIAWASLDINKDCLDANLMSPNEGNSFSKIEIELSHKPENPINLKGNTLNLNAFVSNTPDLNETKIAWSFKVCNDIDSGCSSIPFEEIKGIGKTVGFGLNSVSLPLGDFNSKKYLKVTAKASVNFSAGAFNSGVGTIYIPLKDSGDQFAIFSSKKINGDVEKDSAFERCQNEDPCLVANGETLWLEDSNDDYENYSWIIDGKPFIPENCASGDWCEMIKSGREEVGAENTNRAYFTITKNAGRIHKANLIAENPETGEKIDITRSFQVVSPAIKIKPINCDGDTPERKRLGKYIDGRKIIDWCKGGEADLTEFDFSKKSFFVKKGNSINLKTEFNLPDSGKTLKKSFWTIDGIKVSQTETKLQEALGIKINAENELSFVADREVDDYYTIEFSGYYSENSSEKLISDTIEVKIISEIQANSDSNSKKILATVFTGFPNYLSFLFKTSLLIGLMIFSYLSIFALFPGIKIRED